MTLDFSETYMQCWFQQTDVISVIHPGLNYNYILYYIHFLCIVAPLPIDEKQYKFISSQRLSFGVEVAILGAPTHLTCISKSITLHLDGVFFFRIITSVIIVLCASEGRAWLHPNIQYTMVLSVISKQFYPYIVKKHFMFVFTDNSWTNSDLQLIGNTFQ